MRKQESRDTHGQQEAISFACTQACQKSRLKHRIIDSQSSLYTMLLNVSCVGPIVEAVMLCWLLSADAVSTGISGVFPTYWGC